MKEKEEIEKLKKSNKILYVLVIILLIMVVSIAGILVWKLVDFNDKELEKDEVLKYSAEDALEVLMFDGNEDSEYRFGLVYSALLFGNKNVDDMNTLNNRTKISIGLGTKALPITYGEVKSNLERVFGKGITFVNEDIPCFEGEVEPHIYFDEVTETYRYNENAFGHGGADSLSASEPQVISFKKEKDYYVLEAYHSFYMYPAFGDPDMIIDYYGSYSDAVNEVNKLCSLGMNNENNLISVPDGLDCVTRDKADISKYYFKEANGKLYLAKYKIEKR